jgi:hypothetical protein
MNTLVMRPNDLLASILQSTELTLDMVKKKAGTPLALPGAAALKLFYAFPPPRKQFVSLGLASDHARSRFDDGGG